MTNKPNKHLPIFRRTKEQIAIDNKNFENCSVCGDPLKKAKQRRDSPKTCFMCRGDRASGSTELKQMFKELNSKKSKEVDDWGSQTIAKDDADMYGSFSKQPTQISYGSSSLAEVMESNNKYQYKNGSARDGVRYKRN